MILNLSFLGILVSMLKREKCKVQEANARLAKFQNAEKRLTHKASEDSVHEEYVNFKRKGKRSNTLLQFFPALHHYLYI